MHTPKRRSSSRFIREHRRLFIIQVKLAIKDQIDTRNKVALEKKDKWSKVLSHYKDMNLNIGSSDRKVLAAALTNKTLEVMKKDSIIEAEEKCIALMKKAGVRVRIPLIIVKALISGNWCNESKSLSKLSMFFIEPNSQVDDKESLFLALKMTEGSGFTDEAIKSLLKKEYYISTNLLELKEQLRYITVFHSLFNRTGKSTKGIKGVFDIVSKRD